ncbi:hypothetical protein J2Z21_002696 [Streptomyces griseochromogenes]|uniref:DUF4232 domain-containing protein n=1 Tax=Streptomyces griseochromogenes TaxID=68214 RepID=A0A1B1AY22_9ACTN|nr:DUF4232 domain-containing protein [Streptomyces griseochromogenes]ANP51478.1 hypothetical protein AVL59_19365 [Streptomyces griseochromogenes]MBP2049760.1 hypothetical protein [Streptomyces griseochromogenes]
MQYGSTIRVTASAMAVIAGALSLSACQSGGGDSAADNPSPAPTAASASPTASSASSGPGTATSRPSGGSTSTGSGTPASTASATSGGSASACTATGLRVSAYQAADRPQGTGTGAAVVEFTNAAAQPCVLSGYPSVAGAGNGSPDHNSPLSVTRTGAASAVRVAPGGKAWVKLTFVQVQGEGDGYCASGAKPVVYPTLVVGLPGAGSHQVALSDGEFAECDNKVTATAVSAVKPS